MSVKSNPSTGFHADASKISETMALSVTFSPVATPSGGGLRRTQPQGSGRERAAVTAGCHQDAVTLALPRTGPVARRGARRHGESDSAVAACIGDREELSGELLAAAERGRGRPVQTLGEEQLALRGEPVDDYGHLLSGVEIAVWSDDHGRGRGGSWRRRIGRGGRWWRAGRWRGGRRRAPR